MFFNCGHIPFVTAAYALAVVAARFVALGFDTQVAAVRAFFEHRFVPDDEIAIGVVLATVERFAAFFATTFGDFTAVFGTLDAGGHGTRAAAFGKFAASKEVAGTAVADQPWVRRIPGTCTW